MVRSIVAASVEVGHGRLDPAAVVDILEAYDRSVGKGSAPSRGLTLMSVEYQ
jgi:tRNA U38,U39,U40 pseudouridine synthase TruA